MVKVSVNRFISSRIEAIRNEVAAETRRLRERTLDKLEEIFTVAARVAGGKTKHQRINGKMVSISFRQRRRWLLVANYVVLTMNEVASNFDEKQIHTRINELEKLINEAKTAN